MPTQVQGRCRADLGNERTARSDPAIDANMSGVHPWCCVQWTEAPRSRHSFTIAASPQPHAMMSAVRRSDGESIAST